MKTMFISFIAQKWYLTINNKKLFKMKYVCHIKHWTLDSSGRCLNELFD